MHDVGAVLLDDLADLLDGAISGVVAATDADHLDRQTTGGRAGEPVERGGARVRRRPGLVDHGQRHPGLDVFVEATEGAFALGHDAELDALAVGRTPPSSGAEVSGAAVSSGAQRCPVRRCPPVPRSPASCHHRSLPRWTNCLRRRRRRRTQPRGRATPRLRASSFPCGIVVVWSFGKSPSLCWKQHFAFSGRSRAAVTVCWPGPPRHSDRRRG